MDRSKDKWKSRRLLIAVWCAALATYLASQAAKIDPAWVQGFLALVGVLGVYVGGETWAKKYLDPNSNAKGRKDE